CESEKTLHIREPLCAVEVCRDHSRVLRFINRKAQEIIDRIVMTTRNQTTDQVCGPVQKPVLFIADESNLMMFLEREKQRPVGGERPRRIFAFRVFKSWRAAQRQQGIVRNA